MKIFNGAWQLLKYQTQGEYDEGVYGSPEEYNDMFYEGDGSPRDPRKNPAYDDEDLMLDDMHHRSLHHEIKEMQRTLRPHDGVEPVYTPEEIEEKERREKVEQSVADFLQSQKLASEPKVLIKRKKQNPSKVLIRKNDPAQQPTTVAPPIEGSGSQMAVGPSGASAFINMPKAPSLRDLWGTVRDKTIPGMQRLRAGAGIGAKGLAGSPCLIKNSPSLVKYSLSILPR